MRTSAARTRHFAAVAVLSVTMLWPVVPAVGDTSVDMVTGGFEDMFGERVGVLARSGPGGEDPSGHESATRPGGTRYRLRVVCLAVDGNTAAYGTVITTSNNPSFPPGFEFVEVVRDGGVAGEDGWDIFDGGAYDCGSRLSAAASAAPIGAGDIRITDS